VRFESGSRLERIEEGAFFMSGLKWVEIPGSVTFIDDSAFAWPSLNSIAISRDNRHYRIRQSLVEDICGSTIYRYFGSCCLIVIPSSVVVLGKGSFRECKSLESVIFVSGCRLERIGESAFYGSGLKSISIPFSVVVLGKSSFHVCESLESVRFESGCRLERIEESAFSLSGLKTVLIPSSVVVLGDSSFYWCGSF
jgi:hypothetical protein